MALNKSDIGCNCCGCRAPCMNNTYTSMDIEGVFVPTPCLPVAKTIAIGDTLLDYVTEPSGGGFPYPDCYRNIPGFPFIITCMGTTPEYSYGILSGEIRFTSGGELQITIYAEANRSPYGYGGDLGASVLYTCQVILPADTDCSTLLSPIDLPVIATTPTGDMGPSPPYLDKILWNLNL